jgi:two-component system CheB/CheR fusion protein
VKDLEGRAYSLHIRPYLTSDNRIDGAVITLVDIDGSKQARSRKGKAEGSGRPLDLRSG